ncbi:hypothetical protein [Bradyrhizobium lablabi]|uniref:hypothetical protein n=1 Tax=Bradyrhizobium lablabi TaxID=722472 RepID=UPI0012E3F88E|nr:hypothetical protein [Bradyrhizobium lablabi]
MGKFIQMELPLGTDRDTMRRTFVDAGRATLKIHPTQEGVEKYIYDINLCEYYIWRWNISADYDVTGRLLQAYVNAFPVFPAGKPPRDPRKGSSPDRSAAIFEVHRPRPEARKGESSLAFLMLTSDPSFKTIDDQLFYGGSPTRADPLNLGTLTIAEGEPWRSIFDSDDAAFIARYPGDWTAVDREIERRTKNGDGPQFAGSSSALQMLIAGNPALQHALNNRDNS